MTQYTADFSFNTTLQQDPARIRAAGYSGVLRYVSRPSKFLGSSTENGKNATPAEVGRIRAAGLDLTLNFEQNETRPREGFGAGQQDARDADRIADGLGYPLTCAVYFSVDTSIAWESCRAYFQGVKATLRRPIGIYGGTSVGEPALNEGLVSLFWQANAGSWSGATSWDDMLAHHLSPRASLVQHVHNRTPLHIAGVGDDQFDPNTVLHDNYGQWLAPGKALEDDLGYAAWNDLEKLAFMRDVMNLLVSHDSSGQDPIYKTWGTQLYDFTKSAFANPAAPPTKLDNILAAAIAGRGSGSSVDVSEVLEAVKALPAETIAALKAAL